MAFTDFDAKEINSFRNRLMDMHQNLGEILKVLEDMGDESKVALQLNSMDVYLPRLEIVVLNSVAKAKSDLIQHKYKCSYPTRESKPATRAKKR